MQPLSLSGVFVSDLLQARRYLLRLGHFSETGQREVKGVGVTQRVVSSSELDPFIRHRTKSGVTVTDSRMTLVWKSPLTSEEEAEMDSRPLNLDSVGVVLTLCRVFSRVDRTTPSLVFLASSQNSPEGGFDSGDAAMMQRSLLKQSSD